MEGGAPGLQCALVHEDGPGVDVKEVRLVVSCTSNLLQVLKSNLPNNTVLDINMYVYSTYIYLSILYPQ